MVSFEFSARAVVRLYTHRQAVYVLELNLSASQKQRSKGLKAFEAGRERSPQAPCKVTRHPKS